MTIKQTIREYAQSDRLMEMLDGTEFVHERGAYFSRVHRDGRTQRVRMVWWCNPELARSRGIPIAHLGVGVQLEGTSEVFYKIVLVEEDETLRDWDEVAQEFHDVFMQMLDSPVEDGMLMQWSMDDRYIV